MKPVILFLLLSALSLWAGVTGKLSGRVTDARTGAPLAGANIEISGRGIGASTDAEGYFVILNVVPGKMEVVFSYIGYETQRHQDVAVNADLTTVLQARLSEAHLTLNESIVVLADRPLIQRDLTGSMSVVRREDIESLPVANLQDILSLQAGVVSNGNRFNVRGGRANEVAFLIDGMYVSDPLMGGLATNINNDAIQELTLLSGTFNAEYGNALSGVVNIVTRDGAEQLEAQIETRTSSFGISRYADLEEFRINGNISGPFLSAKTRFFLSAEFNTAGSYLPFGYERNLTFFSKLSFLQIAGVKITLSNRGSRSTWQNYNHDYKYIPDQYLRSRSDDWQSVLMLTHTLSNNLFYDFRLSYFNRGSYSGVDKDTSEYLTSSQWEYFEDYGNGVEFYSLANPLQLTQSRTATADAKLDLVWQPDERNEIKFGLHYKKHFLNLFSIYDPKRDNPYVDDYKVEPYEAALYLQDKLEFPLLVINLGLRYDYANANVRFRESPLQAGSEIEVKPRTQISPRLGIAHPISEKTKLHFSYGHFFQNPDYQYLYENKQYDIGVREPIFGQPSLDAERTIAYEVGLSHQFSGNNSLNLTAYYKDVTGLIGTHYFEFRDAYTNQFTAYTLYVNEDYANIKGFELSLNLRPNRNFSGGLTYTYSIAKGSASSETEQYPGTQESTRLYYLDFDKPHLFNATASYTLHENEGLEIFSLKLFENTDYNLIFSATSGSPYTPSGRDIGFVEKNSLRQPAIYSADLELGKSWKLGKTGKLRLFAEIRNLTDTRNIVYVYRDTGDPDYTIVGGHSPAYMRDPSNYGAPRTVRLGLGLNL